MTQKPYQAPLTAQHPKHDEAKRIEAIRRIRQKMSPRAYGFALAGKIKLPEMLKPLILKALH